MSTPLTDAINALTTYANEITGGTDTDLSAAVATLAAGYGSGTDYLRAKITNESISYSVDLSGGSITSRAFDSWSNLQNVTLWNVYNIGTYSFNGCSKLTTATITSTNSSLLSYGLGFYSGCTSLTTVDITDENGGNIGGSTFGNCRALNQIIIRNSSTLLWLSNVNAFASTPFASGGSGGTIYVPSALISSYKSASNWSTIDGYGTVTWAAIEGSIYETQYANGTAIS